MDKPVEIMRIIRVPPMGKLVVQIGKRQFVSLDDIDNPKAQQIVLAALCELVTFGGGYEKIVEAGFAPPIMPTGSSSTSTASSDGSEDGLSLEEKQAAFLASLERGEPLAASDDVSLSGQTVSQDTPEQRPLSFFNRRGRRSRPEVLDEPLVPRLDIAGELNEILQRHVASDPELSKQEIEIMTGPAGGVRIKVNGQYYEDAATIADPMVRMAIKLATREWEQNN